jgi:hypothetical protein
LRLTLYSLADRPTTGIYGYRQFSSSNFKYTGNRKPSRYNSSGNHHDPSINSSAHHLFDPWNNSTPDFIAGLTSTNYNSTNHNGASYISNLFSADNNCSVYIHHRRRGTSSHIP